MKTAVITKLYLIRKSIENFNQGNIDTACPTAYNSARYGYFVLLRDEEG